MLQTTRMIIAAALGTTGAIAFSCGYQAGGLPQDPEYRILMPSNTGIPGHNNMMFVTFGPDGRLWTHGRDFFWQQGGVAVLDFATIKWKTYSSAETPLDQWCNDMAFAADGSAWIACDDVVVHLHADGETMIGYTPANTGVLKTGPHADISVAPNGHVWVANNGSVDLGGGLFEFDGAQWTKHEEPWMVAWTGSGFAPPLNVIARSNGDVLATFLTAPHCMGRYRNGRWTQIATGPIIIAMAETADGTLYGTASNATYRMNDLTGQWQQIGSFGASQIAIDPNDDSLYIVHNLTSVLRFDGLSWTTFASFPGWVGGFGVAPNGDVWIAAETWLSHYDLHHYTASGQLLRVYNRSNTGMITYFPPGMYLDHDGLMWFTDFEYGASRLEANDNWRNFGQYNGQEEVFPFWVSPVGLPWWQTPGADFWTESIDQVFHDSQGNFWLRGPNIISRSSGADLSQWTTWTPGQAGFPAACDSMGEAADGTIWVGDSFTAYRLDGSSWTEVPIGIQGQFAPVLGWTISPNGELWVARVGTFYRYVNGAFVPIFEIPGLNILQFQFAPNGDLWAATTEGLHRWQGPDFTSLTVYTPANSGMAENAVVSFDIRPSDGLVAVATSQQETLPYHGGVALFDADANEWTSYDYGSSFLPFYAPGDVQFDADGHLWIAVLNFGAVQVFIGESGPQPTIGDVNGDGVVNVTDLLMVISAWGACQPAPAKCPADLNLDGVVNVTDLLTVISNWG